MTDPNTSCEVQLRVRYREVDRMGAVHHSHYWVYFEMGRTELLRRQGANYADLEASGVFFVVVKCSARFRAPARYDDVLTLTTRVVRTAAARIDHAYELKRPSDGRLICTGETTIACVDADSKVRRIPPALAEPRPPRRSEERPTTETQRE